MAIERGKHGFEISCANCADAEELNVWGFHETLDRAKEHGWIVYKHAGAWLHFCGSDCKEQFLAKRQTKIMVCRHGINAHNGQSQLYWVKD